MSAVDQQSVLKRCAACRKENPVSSMKTCMHHQMHYYVCDSKCMHDFYNPPKADSAPAKEPDQSLRDVIWHAHQLADMTIKGDAPRLAERTAQALIGMLAERTVKDCLTVGAGEAPQPVSAVQTDAARDVLAERQRQITSEGWTSASDDMYCAAELPRAAAAYVLNGSNDEAPCIWPFASKWWKPRDARANYVRAAALILAEIERLDRAAHRAQQGEQS